MESQKIKQAAAVNDNTKIREQKDRENHFVTDTFHAIFNDPKNSDVTFLLPDGTKFHGHRIILAARSPYLRNLFYQLQFWDFESPLVIDTRVAPQDNKNASFWITSEVKPQNDILPEAFAQVMEFIYLDRIKQVPFDVVKLHAIAELANILQLNWLAAAIVSGTSKLATNSSKLEKRCSLWHDLQRLLLSKTFSDSEASNANLSDEWSQFSFESPTPFSDLMVVAEGRVFYVHKAIMSCRSWYFESLLHWNWRESSQDDIVLHSVSADLFAALLSFIYANSIKLESLPDALELFRFAQFFSADSLAYLCENFIMKSTVNVQSVCHLWNCAKQLEAENLQESCQKYFIEHFMEVCQTSGFLDLEKDLLKSALNNGEIDENEEAMFHMVKNWGVYNSSRWGASAADLLAEMLPPQTLFNQRIKHRLMFVGDNKDPFLRILLNIRT